MTTAFKEYPDHPLIGRRIEATNGTIGKIVAAHFGNKCKQMIYTIEASGDRQAALFIDQFEVLEEPNEKGG